MRQAGQGAQKGLLGQVIGTVRVAAQMGHESPDIAVGGAYEALDGDRVTVPRGQCEAGQLRVVRGSPLATGRANKGRNHRHMSFGAAGPHQGRARPRR
ncbi:hypothetical protein HEK616_27590 [Streptomyces nigrescens]|uniref:Uncharacterized protein n=1 Tax=Streptomyces nigrescens TaxID=1920 RepID=A0ABM7ZSH0_STRNI|nr:hypothetical protein HEK616_27590 [Streptomyces nigrescens]